MSMLDNPGWYNVTFTQNNSGGYWIGPSSFTVTARNEDEAFAILKSQPWYSEEYCECCGQRWSSIVSMTEVNW